MACGTRPHRAPSAEAECRDDRTCLARVGGSRPDGLDPRPADRPVGAARAQAALGMALSDQGKYEEAIPSLEKSLELDAGNPNWETQYALAQANYKLEKYPEAAKTAQAALSSSNGKAPEIELLVAQSLVATGKYDEAALALRDYVKNHGDRPDAAKAKRWLDRLVADGKVAKN